VPTIRIIKTQKTGPANPFIRILGLVFGGVLFIIAAVIGGVVLAALIGLALIGGLIVYIRFWWLARKAGLYRREESFVEAEYKVVDPPAVDDKRR
jgi:Flp pilus assembly protein TadB